MLKHTRRSSVDRTDTLNVVLANLLPKLTWRHHGIGVLQAYLEDTLGVEQRLHIWSRRLMLPGIEESGIAHNHRFTLKSTIIYGCLKHTEWQIEHGTGYKRYDFIHARLHTEQTRSEMRLLVGEVAVKKVPVEFDIGDEYIFDRGFFHTSLPVTDIAITLVTKIDQVEERAQVIAPANIPPVPAFGGDPLPPNVIDAVIRDAQLRLTCHEQCV